VIAKLGFILVVAAFGALMFAAGAVAPDSVRTKIESISKRAITAAATLVMPATPKAPQAPAADKVAAKAPAAAAAKDDSVALESLLLPAPLPVKGKFAIQAGQFADADAADELKREAADLGVKAAVVPVVDTNGQHWFVVAAGSFDSLDDARVACWPISRDLGKSNPLPLMLLPPEKPKG
jgi:cell division protein FtsN